VRPDDRSLGGGAAALLAVLIALLVLGAGFVAGTGDIRSATVIAGALFGLLLLMLPTIALYSAVIGGLVVVGLTQLYLVELQFVRWSVPVLATALAGLAVVARLDTAHYPREEQRSSPLLVWMTAFLLLGLLTSALNRPTVAEFAFGFKGYFQFWGLFFAIALMRWKEDAVDALPKILVWVALIQLPFVLHQYFVLVPSRIGLPGGVVAEDVVAGTFGASVTGGGANAELSLLLLTALAILTALFKHRLISRTMLALAAIPLLVPIFLNANRLAILYILVGYFLLFARDAFRKPVKTLAVGILAASLLFGIIWTHARLLSRADPDLDVRSFIVDTITRNVSAEHGHGQYELNRWTVYTFWAKESREAPVQNVLLGHGLGASRDAAGGALEVSTLAQWRYEGMGIGLTSAAGILWELGVAGFLCIVGVFWAAFRAAMRLPALHADVPWRAAVFEGLQVAVVLLFLSLFHKQAFLRHLPYQALLMTVLGYLAYWQARAGRRADQGR
jgi:hypothetical protein